MKNSFSTIKQSWLKRSSLALLTGLMLVGCVDNPTDVEAKYSSLRASGVNWVNEEGQKVNLHGVNVGNWLAMESWMFAVDDGDNALGSDINSQYTFEEKLVERFGEAEKDNVLKLWRDNYLTTADWDKMAEANFNLVRIPFFYDLISDESASEYTLKADAFDYLDWAIEQAKQREMYVVLDMHGAPGRQSSEHHTGRKDVNEFWNNADNMAHTKWVWQQIATRYKDESAIAAYGLLNEPWGTDAETLKSHLTELYHAVRKVDKTHIIALHGHNSDDQTQLWKDPKELGLYNVVFEVHPYPGLFGWGEQDYETHRDWLTCGENGEGGVCEWNERFVEQDTPVLMGEMQPWAGLGALGGDITRATFDIYNELGWAATAWSYRAHTKAGGAPNGDWGYVTNAPVNSSGDTVRQLVKADSWACEDWSSTFANACSNSAKSTVLHHGMGEQTLYLLIKAGSDNLDVVFDDIQITNDNTGETLVTNGDFSNGLANWTFGAIGTDTAPNVEAIVADEFAGSDGGMALRLYSDDESFRHGVFYQEITVQGGVPYTISGKFKEQSSAQAWAEVYILSAAPSDGMADVSPLNFTIDVNSASLADIKTFFTNLSTMAVEENPWVKTAMNSAAGSTMFTQMPGKPEALSLALDDDQVSLSWYAPFDRVDAYLVYRSERKTYGFKQIAKTTETKFTETVEDAENTTYYYFVLSQRDLDRSRPTNVVASGDGAITVPGRIEAEGFLASEGVKVDGKSGNSSGSILGSFDRFDWVEYLISVPTAGTYDLTYAWATFDSNATDSQIEVLIDGQLLTNLTYVNNNNWNQFSTNRVSVELPAGKHELRLSNVSPTWVNFDYFEINEPTLTEALALPIDINAEHEDLIHVGDGLTFENGVAKNFTAGDSFEFTADVTSAGSYDLTVTLSAYDAGNITVYVNGVDTSDIVFGDSNFDMDEHSTSLTLPIGEVNVRLVFDSLTWVDVANFALASSAPVIADPETPDLETPDPVIPLVNLSADDDALTHEGVGLTFEDGVAKNFTDGDWFEFTANVSNAGSYELSVTLSAYDAGNISVYLDSVDTADIVFGDANFDMNEHSTSLTLPVGETTIRLVFDSLTWADVANFSLTEVPAEAGSGATVVNLPANLAADDDALTHEGAGLTFEGGVAKNFTAGDWFEFNANIEHAGGYDLTVNLSAYDAGNIAVYVDGVKTSDIVIGDANFDMNDHGTIVNLPVGEVKLRLVFEALTWADVASFKLEVSPLTVPFDVPADHYALTHEGVGLTFDEGVAKNFTAGDWFEFKTDAASAGSYNLAVTLSAYDAGNISVYIDGVDTADIVFGDANFDMNEHSTNISLPEGVTTIRLVFDTLTWADVASFKLSL